MFGGNENDKKSAFGQWHSDEMVILSLPNDSPLCVAILHGF